MPPFWAPNCLRTALYLVAMQTALDSAFEASATIVCLTYTIVPYISCFGTSDGTYFPSLVTFASLKRFGRREKCKNHKPIFQHKPFPPALSVQHELTKQNDQEKEDLMSIWSLGMRTWSNIRKPLSIELYAPLPIFVPISPTIIFGRGEWSSKLRSCTMNPGRGN